MTRRLAALGCVAALAAAPTADAQRRSTRAEAEQLFRAGEAMFKKASYVEAAELFEKALAVLPLPAIAFSAAQAYRLQYFADDDARKLKRAIELYTVYVTEMPAGGRKADAVQSLAELKPRLDRLEAFRPGPIAAMPMPTSATRLVVTTQVAGATVVVDDRPPVSELFSAEVTAGKHRIRVTAPGHVPFDERREVFDGQARVVEVALAPRPALVSVRAAAGAQIAVDGRPVGSAPLVRPIALPAGTHLVAITMRGHRPWSREVSLDRGERRDLSPALERTTQRTVAYVVLAASATSLVAAGVAGAMTLSAGGEASDLDEQRATRGLDPAELARYTELVDSYEGRRTTTFALLGVSGGLAITGALLYALDHPGADEPAPSSSALAVRPLAGGDLAGLAVDGAF